MGRPPGVPNKATIERKLRAKAGLEAAAKDGVMPLDIIRAVMAGGEEAEKITDRQYDAAVAAAPYMHARLAASVVEVKHPLSSLSDEQVAALAAAMSQLPLDEDTDVGGEVRH